MKYIQKKQASKQARERVEGQPSVWATLFGRRAMCVLLLSFSSGLPLALTGTTLQAWYTVAGVNLVAIGALSLVGQPYVYKPLWSPLLDRFTLPFLDHRRGWILLLQGMLAISIAAMAFLNPSMNPLGLALLAVLVAFLSSSQDIAIDAYRTDMLHSEERGWGASLTTFGYRVAVLVSGGVALILAEKIGWRVTYLFMAALMACEMLVTYYSPNLKKATASPNTLYSAIVEPFKEFLTRKSALMLLGFILLYKLGDAFTLSLSSTFFIRALHFSLVEVGTLYKGVGLIATLVGVAIGGICMVRFSLYQALMWFGILQAVSNMGFMLMALVGKSYTVAIAVIAVEMLAGGMGTVAFVAFLMALCDRRFTATQFALLSALAAVGRVFVGPMAGIMVEHMGWAIFYFWSTVLALPGLVVLSYLKNTLLTVLPSNQPNGTSSG